MTDKRAAPRQIAVYGKGGIGKSTTVANLAALYGVAGQKVLLVGCDPKHDTSYRITSVRPVPTVLGTLQQKNIHDIRPADFLVKGRHGITCVEAGGPEPGVGCAGRGLSKMFELFDSMDILAGDWDVILYDVLGDVVCGGFAVPMRRGYAAEVLIVVSGETMALYAANNICRALVRLQHNGVRLAGVIGNLRGGWNEAAIVTAFATRIGSHVLPTIPRDELILKAERERQTVVEYAPDSAATRAYRELYGAIQGLAPGAGVVPRAMGDIGFEEFVREQVFFWELV
jgi:nitrogenase iron protein NifH